MKKTFLSIFISLALVFSVCMGSFVSVQAAYEPNPSAIISLKSTKKTVRVGDEFKIIALTNPYNSNDDMLVWSISNRKVVNFEENDYDYSGDDMEFIALKSGTAVITCRIRNTRIKKTYTVKVKKSKTKAKIVVDDTFVEVDVGEWEHLEARLKGGNYKNRKLKYSVKNKKIATVKNGRVYGKKPGLTKIVITSKANKNIKKTITVRVEFD